MNINLRSNFDLGLEAIELEGSADLRSLLVELSKRSLREVKFIDSQSNEVDDSFLVAINGQEYQFLPERLETRLKDGDEVGVLVMMFAGG
jgi:hypothetical protein